MKRLVETCPYSTFHSLRGTINPLCILWKRLISRVCFHEGFVSSPILFYSILTQSNLLLTCLKLDECPWPEVMLACPRHERGAPSWSAQGAGSVAVCGGTGCASGTQWDMGLRSDGLHDLAAEPLSPL